MKCFLLGAAAALSLAAGTHAASFAQADDPYIGDIFLVGFNFCPRGFAEANGQLIAINQNTALYSLYGTIYGGDGINSFALPDMRGRIPIHQGQGNGLSYHPIGARGGSEYTTLTVANMPGHSHGAYASDQGPGAMSPEGNSFSNFGTTANVYGNPPNTSMDHDLISPVGQGQQTSIMSPSVALRYCVSLFGLYPSRN